MVVLSNLVPFTPIHFDSILDQLKTDNRFVLAGGKSGYTMDYNIVDIYIYGCVLKTEGAKSLIWVTNDERRRIIKFINNAKIKSAAVEPSD